VFQAASVLEVCSKHMLEAPVPPSQRLGKALPADLEAIVLGCLAKDRDARPASAAILRTSLLACADIGRYDLTAARAWWQAHRVSRKESALSVDPIDDASSPPATMAIDLAAGAPRL
jgi:serine/threonine-protein kinase